MVLQSPTPAPHAVPAQPGGTGARRRVPLSPRSKNRTGNRQGVVAGRVPPRCRSRDGGNRAEEGGVSRYAPCEFHRNPPTRLPLRFQGSRQESRLFSRGSADANPGDRCEHGNPHRRQLSAASLAAVPGCGSIGSVVRHEPGAARLPGHNLLPGLPGLERTEPSLHRGRSLATRPIQCNRRRCPRTARWAASLT